jgi:putative tricarboxylic transport membrane protein
MRARVANPKEFCAGILFFGIGLGALIVARDYRLGTAMRMGPGYFPLVLSVLLMLLGAVSSLRALRMARGAPVGQWRLMPLMVILLAVVAFGALVERGGLVAALLALLLICTAPRLTSRPLEALSTIALLTASAVALFVYGLGMPFSLF